jgi:hypothetical protein
MNRILLVLAVICAGALGLNSFRQAARRALESVTARNAVWQASAKRLAAAQATTEALRGEVSDQQDRLRQITRHPELSPELLLLLDRQGQGAPLAAWADLRQRLGLGWDSSPDYVLVSKSALKQVQYQRLDGTRGATDTASDLLAFSPSERSAIRAALEHARDAAWASVQRTQPTGDIVAQYTFPAMDSALGQTLSNNFAAQLTAAIGPERAGFLLPQAWNIELRHELSISQGAETMTIRQTVVDGEPDLICEMKYDNKVETSPVRHARYPYGPVLTYFPGGWQTIAQREGFDLPRRFHDQN